MKNSQRFLTWPRGDKLKVVDVNMVVVMGMVMDQVGGGRDEPDEPQEYIRQGGEMTRETALVQNFPWKCQ